MALHIEPNQCHDHDIVQSYMYWQSVYRYRFSRIDTVQCHDIDDFYVVRTVPRADKAARQVRARVIGLRTGIPCGFLGLESVCGGAYQGPGAAAHASVSCAGVKALEKARRPAV